MVRWLVVAWLLGASLTCSAASDPFDSSILVEVFENEQWFLHKGGRWLPPAAPHAHWSYHDGLPALPREEIQPPDGWEWASPWRIDSSAPREPTRGWEYATEVHPEQIKGSGAFTAKT